METEANQAVERGDGSLLQPGLGGEANSRSNFFSAPHVRKNPSNSHVELAGKMRSTKQTLVTPSNRQGNEIKQIK